MPILLIIQILVTGKDVALEFLLVGVPELGGLGVQWARAASVRTCPVIASVWALTC
jgi:hypothetical protein